MDADVSKELQKVFKKQGIKFATSHKVNSVVRDGDTIVVKATDKKDREIEFSGDYCLVSVGRKAYTAGLDLDKVGLEVNERGQVSVNDHLQTNVSNIYAIGDVVKGAMLAHKAEEEGAVVAEYIAGEKPHINYNLIPNIVYTWPEAASVGKTEQELKEAKIEFKAGKFLMRALGRSRASGDIDGFVKVLADKNTDEILGVHMVGARVADLIMEAAVAMEFRASAEDLARICHGHPTYSEAVKEAAKAAWDGMPLNA
jgi:dihydrolipoamide dehydrogenase